MDLDRPGVETGRQGRPLCCLDLTVPNADAEVSCFW